MNSSFNIYILTHGQLISLLRNVALVLLFAYWFAPFLLFQVDSSYDVGDYEAAKQHSKVAKWLNILSIVGGLVIVSTIIAVRVT